MDRKYGISERSIYPVDPVYPGLDLYRICGMLKMPSWKGITRLLLVVPAAVILAGCASTRSSPAGDDSGERLEDTGKRLAGVFLVASVEDAYRDNRTRTQPSAVITFDENGLFKRQDNSRIDEGAYLIAGSGELVIFIEKVNGEFLTSARVERYAIDDQRDESITLSGPSRTLVLRKR